MDREKVKDIINQIGKLENTYCSGCTRFSGESTKETLCITQCEIGKRIRTLGKQLQALENPNKCDPYAVPSNRQRITKEILLELSPHHTNEEIAEQLEVSVESVRNYKSRWKIKGKNKKPGPERKNA